MHSLRCLSLVIALTLLSSPARAWDQKGHRVVAAVAWDHMDAETRTKAVALLRGAPGDSDLLAEDAGSALPQAARETAELASPGKGRIATTRDERQY